MDTMRGLTQAWVSGRIERREIATTTGKSYRDALDQLCSSVGRETPPSEVTPTDLEAFAGVQARRVGVTTLRLRLKVVKLFFRWALEEGYVERDPARRLRVPRQPRSVPRGLPDADVGRLLAATSDEREALIISLMLYEGCRAIEVSRLELGDVDRQTMSVHLVGKGGHERVVPLSDATARRIDAYVAAERGRIPGRLVLARRPSLSVADGGLDRRTIAKLVSIIMHEAGIPESGHALRHTAAHGVIEAGARPQDLQAFLGHQSLSTSAIYMRSVRVEELRPFVGRKHYGGDDIGSGPPAAA